VVGFVVVMVTLTAAFVGYQARIQLVDLFEGSSGDSALMSMSQASTAVCMMEFSFRLLV